MTRLNVSTRLLTNLPALKKRLGKYVLDQARFRLTKARYMLEEFVKSRLRNAIYNSPIYHDAMNGQLRFELGLESPDRLFNPIIDRWVDSIEVSLPVVDRDGVTLVIRGVQSDYADVLSMPEATYLTEKGSEIPWLKWLLLSQDAIAEYNIKYGSFAASRTGGAVMIKTGHGWQLTGDAAGSPNDNFITEALTAIYPEIEVYIQSTVRRMLQNG